MEINTITKEGYLIDFISDISVKATPEEIDAVQVFSRQLVEDYNYPKEYIQTRPQYRVRARPSDTKNEYPVDIAIFNSEKKDENSIQIIVECKKKNRRDGIKQLQDYLKFSKANLGVWFNGNERIFIQKIEYNGTVDFVDITNIPRFGETMEDIGRNKPIDLKVPHNLKAIFKVIHNYLVANATDATRSEFIARNLINIIFCKIYDEKTTKPNDFLKFSALALENHDEVNSKIVDLFNKTKSEYGDVFSKEDIISLDPKSIKYVVGELQNYSMMKSERDVIADAFETFIGTTLKGESGQFFTPRNVVKLMVKICNPQLDQKIIDPACGTGGFLLESLRHSWNILDKNAQDYKWSDQSLFEERMKYALHNINGIEKDGFLAKVAKAYMAIMGDGKGGLYCEDSLENPNEWNKAKGNIILGNYDFVLTNPPFGKEIFVKGEEKLSQYDLGHKMKIENGVLVITNKIVDQENPQILFIERSLQLLKDGGKLAIILPETYFHAPSVKNIRLYLEKHNIQWLIDIPHNTFRPYCNAKCVIAVIQKNRPQQTKIKMAVAEEIGHNHNGGKIFRWDYENSVPSAELWDDIPLIIDEVESGIESKFTFSVDSKIVLEKDIFVPRYYWSNKQKEVETISKEKELSLISIEQLMAENIISTFDGHGSPKSEYKGMGETPYIRVKDIVNWEIYKDPTALIPEEVALNMKSDVKELFEEDVVYVKRGSYRIGSSAMVSPFDTDVVLTREILVLRVSKLENKYNLDPYYLIYLLNHPLVAMQTKNKVFIETTLPNIGHRWKEVYLPISNNVEHINTIKTKVKSAIKSKWSAVEELKSLEQKF